jgi:branched-chain amino acid transport system substrate-binding protein
MTKGGMGSVLRLLAVSATFILICFSAVSLAAEPVKIGYLLSLSGVYASLGEDLRDGLNLYLDQNGRDAGGRKIEVIIENISSAGVTLTQELAHKLMTQDRVDIIAGVIDSRVAYSVADHITQRDIPFIISNAGADELTQKKANPLIIRVSFTCSSGSHPLGVWAYQQGFRKAVAIGPANPGGLEHVGGMCKTFTQQGGKVIQEIWPPLGTQDFRPFLAQVKNDADVLMVFFSGGDAIRFVQQYEEVGLKGKIPIITKGNLVTESLLPQQGKAAEGIISSLHWCLLLDTPENANFRSAYTRKYNRPPSVFAEQGYVTGMIISEALKKTNGQVKGKEFVNVMRALELKAPRGTLKFDEYGAPIQNYYIRKVEMADGQHQNVIVHTYPNVSQFWKWNPAEFMGMTPYADMKGQWAPR